MGLMFGFHGKATERNNAWLNQKGVPDINNNEAKR